MFRCTYEIEILPLYLVHHGVHFFKAHNACNDIGPDHEGGHTVSKAPADHKVPCIGYYRGMKPGNVSHQVVEAIARNLACRVKINTLKGSHNIGMIGYLKIRHHRLSEALYLDILGIVLSDGNGRVDDVGDNEHLFIELLCQDALVFFELCKTVSVILDLLLYSFSLVLLPLLHESADLFGKGIT